MNRMTSPTRQSHETCRYVGSRHRNRSVVVTVSYPDRGQPGDCLAHPLPHVHRHSPDGFEWGYGGSGPADLALSILCHHFGGNCDLARELYQPFKWQFVSSFEPNGWTLTTAEIQAWLNEHPGLIEQADTYAREQAEWRNQLEVLIEE